MSKKQYLLFLFIILTCSCTSPSTMEKNNSNHPNVDLFIYGGTIYTLHEQTPTIEAIGVSNGKIVFTGNKQAAENAQLINKNTQIIDLQGKTMIPGFIESHGHLLPLGKTKMILDLSQVHTFEEIVDLVAAAVQKAKPNEWIEGQGWHQDKWERMPDKTVKNYPIHEALSKVAPNHPVWLLHTSIHMGLANAKAMEIAGISPSSVIDGEGDIIRDEQGKATGIFTEDAMSLITQHIPQSTTAVNEKAMQLAIEECLKNGITSFHDAASDNAAITTYKAFLAEGKLPIRLYAMLWHEDTTLVQQYLNKGPEIGLGNNFLTIRTIKLMADGALGSRGAWLLEEYSDQKGHFGHATIPLEQVQSMAEQALKAGFQVATHAIGDRTNREILNQYEKAFANHPDLAQNHRFRIEHAQHLHPIDIPRFAELGVLAAIQSIHFSSDRPWAVERMGLHRLKTGGYVWQKLWESGAVVLNGTDVPVEPIHPIACFYSAVSRQTLKGEPKGGYEPDQRLSREQALKSYTINAAYGAFEEEWKGSIELGKVADLTILSQDIMTVPMDQILNTKVEYTIVDGKVVYERKE